MPEGIYFFIRSRLSGLVMDIKGCSDEPGTPIIMWEENGDENQLWYTDFGRGVIRSKLNNMVMEVGDDNRLVLGEYNSEEPFNQQWMTNIDRIQHRQFVDRVLDIVGEDSGNGAEICAWQFKNKDNQLWDFEYQEANYFMIVSDMSDKCLDIQGQDPQPDAKLIMWSKHGGDNQLWYCDRFGVLRSKLNGLCIEDPKGEGKSLRMAKARVGNPHQIWSVNDDGLIANRAKPLKVVDIKNSSCDDGAKVIAWSSHGKDNQHFHIELEGE